MRENGTVKLFLLWTAGLMLPLAFMALGAASPLLGLMSSDDFTSVPMMIWIALSITVITFVLNLAFLNQSKPALQQSRFVVPQFAAAAIGAALGAVWVGLAVALLVPLVFGGALAEVSRHFLGGGLGHSTVLEIFFWILFAAPALVAARVFGAVIFFLHRNLLGMDEASTSFWRTAHHWGFLPYPFFPYTSPSGPIALTLILCGTALPYVALTGRAFVHQATAGFLRSRLPILLSISWVAIALMWMPYSRRAERAFLWPLHAVGMRTDDVVWERSQVPDRDGLLTFREHGYRFRAAPNQVGPVVLFTATGERMVELSIDRRDFGASEPPGSPRISCAEGVCSDICADGASCPDLERGWYRVLVIPVGQSWGLQDNLLNLGPQPGVGSRCGESDHAGLDLCWDTARGKPDVSTSNDREVAYAALRPAQQEANGIVWVSRALDSSGKPAFVAICSVLGCTRTVERGGARVQVTFDAGELEDWQRFNAGVASFANRLIEPMSRHP